MSTACPIFIHVGFTNTGTTSLQRNFFATRRDIFYAGEPYGERGGIFTAIKSVEDFKLDVALIEKQCEELIYAPSGGRPIVISDESLGDTPQLYFGSYVVPRDTIALRLHRFFPSAKIIITIRDQRHYAMSAYFNLKRNTAFFDGIAVPCFSSWLGGVLSRDRCHFMQNLNFSEMVSLYAALFGRENICVLPLEMLVVDGAETYLRKLCAFLGVSFSEGDVANYVEIHNRRMSRRRELVAELLPDARFAEFFGDLTVRLGREQFDAFLDEGPRATVNLSAEDEQAIRRRVGIGNWLVAHELGLDLARYEYPLASDDDLTEQQLGAAKEELAYREDIGRLHRCDNGKELVAAREVGEIARLRELTVELATVRQSPVWRMVERLDRVRRMLVRGKAGQSQREQKTPAALQSPLIWQQHPGSSLHNS